MRSRFRVCTALLAALAGVLLTAGSANAQDGSGQSEAEATTSLAIVHWKVSRNGDGEISGFFDGNGGPTLRGRALLPPNTNHLFGPAVCIEFDGNKVGFVYRFDSGSTPTALNGQYAMIIGVDNGGNGRDRLGFIGPGPRELFPGCRPVAEATWANVYKGRIKVNSG